MRLLAKVLSFQSGSESSGGMSWTEGTKILLETELSSANEKLGRRGPPATNALLFTVRWLISYLIF